MITPELSVIIPCFNRSEYLRETLRSLRRQTFEKWEAVIVDDHSTEDINAVITECDDDRFRYIRNEGEQGPSASRNLGNKAARAEILVVADSDDIILPRRLQIISEHFQAFPDTDLFYANVYWFQDGTYDLRAYKPFAAYDRDLLYERDFIPHATVAYKKDAILEMPYDETLRSAIDYDMLLQFADRNKCFRYTTEPVVLYRQHREQISSDPERSAEQKANSGIIKEKHAPYRHSPMSLGPVTG